MIDLNTLWFLLLAVLLGGYAILDGYDLGVGVLSLFTRDEHERRIYLNAIGPVWDGNEVWLLTGGGALFAAFPAVYATVFSGFYLAMMLVLVGLILRAVSLEFRGKIEDPRWKRAWDLAFGIGSSLPALLYGVAVGNVLRGIPINAAGEFTGGFLGLLNPYALLAGVTGLALFTLHGALFLTLKTEGELRDRVAAAVPRLWAVLIALYGALTVWTVLRRPALFEGGFDRPLMWLLGAVLLLLLGTILLSARRLQFHRAFLASCGSIACILGLAGQSMFPRLVISSTSLANSLTIYNSSSSPRTLTVMLVIALVGMPFVVGYTWFIHKVFGGKVVLTEESY